MYKLIDFKDGIRLLYAVETNHLFKVSVGTAHRLQHNALNEEEQKELDYLVAQGAFDPLNHEVVSNASYMDGENFTINVNLTHHCNLSCRYCFAQGGDYGTSQKDLMEPDILQDIERLIQEHVTHTRTARIEFFGGEPLLNTAMIEQIYELCKRITREKGIRFIYRVSTNLTVLSNRILRLFKEGNFVVSVSIDGAKMTQDYNRPGKHGEGYYQAIIDNCNKVRNASETIILVARMTIYQNSARLSDNIKALQQLNIFDYFQISPAFIPAVSQDLSPEDKPKLWRDNSLPYTIMDTVSQEYSQFIDEYEDYFSKQNRFSGNLEFERIADMIINKKVVNAYCSAGRTYLTLSPDRSIVPCHRLIGNELFLIGYSNNEKRMKPEAWCGSYLDETRCASCWGRYLCGGGCKQQNYLRTGDINKPDPGYCREELKVIEKVLCSLYRQSKDYYERDRKVLDRLFVSCGRPILVSNKEIFEQMNVKGLTHFEWVV